ncbi:MAG: HNH endonuclease [Candidatus Bathyarchaeota archaeon]|nr:HNH endonuclease [Candidatus Bathyarchaeota archaeon]
MLVEQLVFRKLTDADFFNINKPSGVEERGGGQSYIDFNTSTITLTNWRDFFHGVRETRGISGPIWKFDVWSLGAKVRGVQLPPQKIKIAQRRPASVAIRSQKLLSGKSERVNAWRPDITGFPVPPNPRERSHIYNLHIYIARLDNGEYWAGWFKTSQPEANWSINAELNKMFDRQEGYLQFSGDVSFDTNDSIWPFRIATTHAPLENVVTTTATTGEEPQEKSFFDEDERLAMDAPATIKEEVRKVRVRNVKANKKLKQLYGGVCQISGEKYSFKKADGTYYSEGHHLIPLGEGGADSVYNIVILSPLLHRMLHYAIVEGLDLSQIRDNKLNIKINGDDYVITWHPQHGEIIREFAQ